MAPAFFSYSALKLYGLGNDKRCCPYAYYLRYILKRKGRMFNCRPFFVAWVCHKLQERWVNECGMAKDRHLTDFAEEVRDTYLSENRVVFKGESDKELLFGRISAYSDKIEAAFYEKALVEKKLEAEVELKIWSKTLECFLYARVDLFDKNGLALYDLKVTENKSLFDRVQATFILLLASKRFKKPINRFVEFVPLCEEPFVLYDISESEKGELFREVTRIVGDIRDGKFDPLASSSKCNFCELNEFCKYHNGAAFDLDPRERKIRL